jgi:hypothetical protein
MELCPFWGDGGCSASQKAPLGHIYGTGKFITVLTRIRHSHSELAESCSYPHILFL